MIHRTTVVAGLADEDGVVGFQLESAESLVGTNSWSVVTNVPSFQINTLSVTNDTGGARKFFRLHRL